MPDRRILMLKSEPVLFAGLARLAVLAAAYFGFHVDADTLLAAFGAIELVIMPLVRARVTPVAKVPGKPTLVFMCCVALFGCSGCGAALQTLDDVHRTACDVLGDEQRAAIEAEAVRSGVSPAEALAIFRATCLLRMQSQSADVAGAAIGAIGKTGSKPCAE
jgi:hypothetical protein